MKQIGKNSFLIFLCLLLALEIFSRFSSPFRNYPSASSEFRNPIHRLGWPEYTAGPSPQGKDLIVFIGNSQGVGFEMENAQDIYFAQVKQHFERKNPKMHFENWSHGGIRSSNVELLFLQAIRRGAKKIVLLLHHDNFDHGTAMRIDYSISDIPLLLAQREVAKNRKYLLLNDQLTLEDRLGVWLKYNYSTLRNIEYWRYQASHLVPNSLIKFVYGSFIPRGGVIDFRRFPDLKKEYHENWDAMGGVPKRKLQVDSVDFAIRKVAFDDFQRNMENLAEDHAVEIVWVFPPTNAGVFDEETTLKSQSLFYNPSTETTGHAYNLTLSLTTDNFISRGHLSKEGHKQMAELLIKTLENEF